ncbi:hypothetical protein SAMN04488691_103239 [Haloferax larsenii]|uniref:Uncharacterized protein n=2 Tax=Haloferax larsenii TaxID=302484 RepID=A0A1H7NBP1_HALLR|nr:hypothetical protein SAMN04488691_103239 [Haloferax larsenii]
MLEQVDWDDPLNRLRVGVVLTFSLYERRDEKYLGYNIDELSDGTPVFLIRPAWLNKGYDFKVCVEGWDDSANPAPSHPDVYSDLYWKREHDDADSFEAICKAVLGIYEGDSPDEVLEEYGDEFNFTVGRVPEALLKPLPWLFIEQDIRYWNYSGRDKTIELVKKLYDGVPLSELDLKLQDLDEIHDTPLAIPNQ